MARSTARNEFMFLTSVRIPNGSVPRRRSETFASTRIWPFSISASETSMTRSSSLSSRLLLRVSDVSDAEMENGQMRVEANVSLRRRGTEPFGIRTEVKNMNSFRAVERALDHEIERQAAALDLIGDRALHR